MKNIEKIFFISLLFLQLFSCTKQQEKSSNTFAPKVIEAKGYVVPKDSMIVPTAVPIGNPTTVKAGTPNIILTNTNVHIAGEPIIVFTGKPQVRVPGTETFSLPKIITAVDSPFAAGIPEVVIAKDAYIKDQNPQNFSSFGKLQGLKHGNISCLMQDKSGNIWFGTEGGASKYDGKSFSHFTEKDGLSNNDVRAIVEDKRGNLWFGTLNGGVSKYDGRSFTHFSDTEGLSNNFVLSILEDRVGNIWFGTNGGGVNKYDGNRVEAIESGENIPPQLQKDLKKINGKLVKSFTQFTQKQGLSSNIVRSILEDRNGNIWFGTEGGGLSKYDGNSFTYFTEKDGLCNNDVRSILEDKKGNLWFGTNGGGVSKYDGKSFTNLTNNEGLSSNFVSSIMEDNSGNIWFGTLGGGLNKYDGSRVEAIEKGENISQLDQRDLKKINGKLVKSFTYYTDEEGLCNNLIFSILEDKSGNIWFGSYGGGLSKYDGKSFTHFTEKEGLSNNGVYSILEDKNGNLWFGTKGGGVNKYDGKSFSHYTQKEGLSSNVVLSILADKNGNIWFGTKGGGVCRYDAGHSVNGGIGKLGMFTHFTEKEGLSNNIVRRILEDKNGSIWFGTDGGGLTKYDGNIVEAVERGEKIPLQLRQDLKKVNGKYVKSFTHFTEKEGLSNNSVYSILEDKRGNLWIGTAGGGVTKYDPSAKLRTGSESFTHFIDKDGLSNNSVVSMLEDKKGNLWFGTGGGGIDKYDGNRIEAIERGENIPLIDQQDLKKVNGKFVKSFTHFTEREGLINNFVFSMLEDKNGNLWFGTRFGLSKLVNNYIERMAKLSDKANNEQPVLFKNYTYEDGFLGIGCNSNSLFEDKNGTIWIGANNRLTAFHPEGEASDTIPPNIQVTSIELFNENIAWVNLMKDGRGAKDEGHAAMDTSLVLGNGVKVTDFNFDRLTKWYNLPENLSLAYNNNFLTFNFIGITQKQNKKVKYQYKLDGLDDNWSAVTSRTEAPYANLPQGAYAFKVKAMNSEGYWSNVFNYTFTIRPPWYETWWFRSLVAVIILVLLYSFYSWRTASLRENKKQLEKTVIERTAEVVHQKDEAEKQRILVEKKQKEILDSITYAKRIQDAILPSDILVKKWLPDSFILYRPKDIVAGDFYWIEGLKSHNTDAAIIGSDDTEEFDTIIFAAADCTGHGVPGAMVSVVCNNALNRALREFELDEPGKLLDKTRGLVIEQFEKSNDEVKDGMDISLCALNTKTNQLQWAGANNPLWIIREGTADVQEGEENTQRSAAEDMTSLSSSKSGRGGVHSLIEYKANKQPIGKYPENKPFTNHLIQLQKGDSIYIFTDGFVDQFGGEKGKKFKAAKMRKLLLSIQWKNMSEQLVIINKVFEDWKGTEEQVDDICMIGVRC